MSFTKIKRDRNHTAVKQWLEAHGCEVREFNTPLDLLVWKNGVTAWVEVKMPGSDACFTRKQLTYISETRHNVVIATTPEGALAAMREKQWLTDKQKAGISGMLVFSRKDRFTPHDVNKAIGK